MNKTPFHQILHGAVSGDHKSLEEIFEMYSPLIEHNSLIDGKLDEDLRQYILIHIALNISKFNMSQ